MENSNQPAFSLQDVSELSAKRKQGEKEKPDCILVGAEERVEAEERAGGDAVWCSPEPSWHWLLVHGEKGCLSPQRVSQGWSCRAGMMGAPHSHLTPHRWVSGWVGRGGECSHGQQLVGTAGPSTQGPAPWVPSSCHGIW